jgi:hypothetical protein
MTAKELASKTRLLINKHPEIKEDIISYYELAMTEIEEGGNESIECERAAYDMDDVVNYYLNS